MQQRRNLSRWVRPYNPKTVLQGPIRRLINQRRFLPSTASVVLSERQPLLLRRIDHCCYTTSSPLRYFSPPLQKYITSTGTSSKDRWKYNTGNDVPSLSRYRYPISKQSSVFAHLSTTTSDKDDTKTFDVKSGAILSVAPSTTTSANPTSVRTTTTMMQYIQAYSALSKFKLSSLVVATTAAGYIAAGPIPYDVCNNNHVLLATITGTAFCSACASGYNQIYERNRDKLMKRTQTRPLVTGIVSPIHATMVTTLWGAIGTTTLYYYTDPITTVLGFGNIVLYAGLYTPLKPFTIYNTWIGAIVGAIPPLIGYTAATAKQHTSDAAVTVVAPSSQSLLSTATTTSDLVTTPPIISSTAELLYASSSYLTDPIAISLVSILYFWQLPHFMALSYMYRMDYKRGGFQMVPTMATTNTMAATTTTTTPSSSSDNDLASNDSTIQTDSAGVRTANIIVRYAWYLSMVPIFSTITDVTSSMYLFESIVLNVYALRVAYKFRNEQTNQNARNIFLTSLWYLPCTLMLFLLHSKVWDNNDATHDEKIFNQNMLTQFVSEQIHTIRNKGRELCIHEHAIVKKADEDHRDHGIGNHQSEASCPVVIVRKTDPNDIHINIHPATTSAAAMTATRTQEASTKE